MAESAAATAPSRASQDSKELAAHTPRRDIQGLRAIAVAAVVAFHADLPVPGGYVGVDIFFVVSGFVITAMLMREHQRTGHLVLRNFFRRRIKRLLPALALMVTITAVVTALVGAPFNGQQEITALTGAGAVLAVANIVLALRSGGYFETPPTANPLLHTWSLSVEEQFYLVYPLILILLWAVVRRRAPGRAGSTWVPAGILVLAIGSFALSWLMSTGRWDYRFSDPEVIAFYSAPTRAWEFAAGALLAILSGRIALRGRLASASLILGLLGIGASCFLLNESTAFPGTAALVPVLATVAALAGGGAAVGLVSRTLSSRPMVAIGDLSYSWYLWHWPLIAFALLLWPDTPRVASWAALLSLGVAWLSFRFVENPLRFDPRMVGRRLVLLALFCVGGALAACWLLLLGSRALWWSDDLKSMDAQVSAEHAWLTEACNSSTPLGERDPTCTWNGDADGAAMFLLGDSQAGMLTEAMIGAAEIENRPMTLGTKGACPFISTMVHVDAAPDQACYDFVERSTAWLEHQPPATVVVSSWAAYMWLSGVGLSPAGQSPTYAETEKRTHYATGLRATLTRLVDAGHQVLVVAPIPGFPEPNPQGDFWYPYQCHTLSALADPSSCGQSMSETQVRADLATYAEVITSAASAAGAQILDLTDELCRDGVCSTNWGNSWAYLDGQHISVGESERLAPVFAALK